MAFFPKWRATPVEERAQILERAADLMESRRMEINSLLILEAAKPWVEADGDTSEAIDFLRFYAVEMRRLPELICGFPRRPGEGPTQYPVACAPQAWAAGSVFMLLSAALGLSVDGCNEQVTLARPVLPASIPTLRLTGLPVGGGSIDLLIENHPHDVGVTVLRRDGDVRVIVVK